MKTTPRRVVMWLVALLLPVYLTSCDSKSDELVGTWTFSDYGQGIRSEGVRTFYAGGKGNASITMTAVNGERIQFVGSYTWELDGDQLSTTMTSSNLPQFMPVGYTTVQRLEQQASNSMVLVNDGGKKIRCFKR